MPDPMKIIKYNILNNSSALLSNMVEIINSISRAIPIITIANKEKIRNLKVNQANIFKLIIINLVSK